MAIEVQAYQNNYKKKLALTVVHVVPRSQFHETFDSSSELMNLQQLQEQEVRA